MVSEQLSETISEAFAAAVEANRIEMEEALNDHLFRLEDIGWTKIGEYQSDDDGPTTESLKRMIPELREMTALAPHMKRGAQLHHAYVFGEGVIITGLDDDPKIINALNDPDNQEIFSGVIGQQTLTTEKFCAGNVILVRNERNNTFTLIPFEQVTGVMVDPDDSSKIHYIQRTFPNDTERKVWYPLARFKKRSPKIQKTIGSRGGPRVPVSQYESAYVYRGNRQAGWTWGMPDSIAAKKTVIVYSKLMANASTLTEALAAIAWQVKTATSKGQSNAASTLKTTGIGGTAVQGAGNELSNVGVPSATVSFQNFQPVAALTATALGVPVIALLSDSGAGAGSYGAATTLSDPTMKGFRAIQDSWRNFYREILLDMGAPSDVDVTFPALEQDPTYREVQSVLNMFAAGTIHVDEARAKLLALVDIIPLHDEAPEHAPDYQAPAQGVSGDGPAGGFDQDETNNDE